MKDRLFNFLQVKKSDLPLLDISIQYALLIGICQSLLDVVPIALFLSAYNPSHLPMVYVITNIVLVTSGLIYNWVEKKLLPDKLFGHILLLMSACFFLLWGMMMLKTFHFLFLLLFIVAKISFIYTDLTLWGSVNAVMTLQQGKRLFGLVATARSFAGIIANLSIPLLLLWFNVAWLISGIAVTLLLSVKFNYRIFKLGSKTLKKPEKSMVQKEHAAGFGKLLKHQHVRNLLLTVVGGVILYYAIDIYFNQQVAKMFVTSEKIASFLALFYAICDGIVLLGSSLVSRYIFERFSVISCSNILPIGTLLLSFVILSSQHILSPIGLFCFVVLLKVWNVSAIDIITWPGFLLLSQTLKKKVRMQLQAFSEIIATPISGIIGSAAVATLLSLTFNVNILFSILISLMSLFLILSMLRTQSTYLSTLKDALSEDKINVLDIEKLDKTALDLFYDKVKFGDIKTVRSALHLLQDMDSPYYKKALLIGLSNSCKEVVVYILKRYKKLTGDFDLIPIQSLAKHSDNDDIRKHAIEALIKPKGLDDATVKEMLEQSHDKLIELPIIQYILANSKTFYTHATKRLHHWLTHGDLHKQNLAVKTLQHHYEPTLKSAILPLYQTNSTTLKKSLLFLHNDYYDKSFFKLFDDSLSDIRLRSTIIIKLKTADDSLLQHIKQQMQNYPLPIKRSLLLLLKNTYSTTATDILWQQFQQGDYQLTHCCLLALEKKSLSLDAEKLAIINDRIQFESDKIINIEGLLSQNFNEPIASLKGPLINEISRTQAHLNSLLLLKYENLDLIRVLNNLQSDNPMISSYAIELLGLILNRDDHSRLLPLLQLRTSDLYQIENNLEDNMNDTICNILNFIDTYKVSIDVIFIARVLRILGDFDRKKYHHVFTQYQSNKNPIIKEVVEWGTAS